MKTVLRFALAVLLGLGLTAYATYTKQGVRITRFQADPTYTNGTATATACIVTAYGENVMVNDSDATDVIGRGQSWRSVSFDLLDPNLAAVNITAAGKTVTYPKLAALMRQACLDRANAAGVN